MSHSAWEMKGFRKLADVPGDPPELATLIARLDERQITHREHKLWAIHPGRGTQGVRWGSRVWVNQRYLFIARSIADQVGIRIRKAVAS